MAEPQLAHVFAFDAVSVSFMNAHALAESAFIFSADDLPANLATCGYGGIGYYTHVVLSVWKCPARAQPRRGGFVCGLIHHPSLLPPSRDLRIFLLSVSLRLVS